MLDTGCWILDTGYWILDAGSWIEHRTSNIQPQTKEMARRPVDLKDEQSPKTQINTETLRQALVLITYLKPYRGKFIMGLVFIALSAFTTSLSPLFLGKMIDAASPGTTLPGSDTASQFGFGFKDI